MPSPWNTLSVLPDDLLNIFQISVETTLSKQHFLTLTQLRSPCYVDIWNSVLFPFKCIPVVVQHLNFKFTSFLLFY